MKVVKKHILFLFISISKITLFIINFYYGISSFIEMLYDTFRLKLYFNLFWDYSRHSFKYEDYMDKAIAYHTNPIYCILITIAIMLLSILLLVYHKRNNLKYVKLLLCISIFLLAITILIIIGVLYCYFDEIANESV